MTIESTIANLSDAEIAGLYYDFYTVFAREKQHPPSGDWLTWFILAGRGWGKTRTGAEWVRHRVETGQSKRIALVGPTAADARDVMVEGESGLLNISPPWNTPEYEPSKRRITWKNGAMATLYSAEEPDRLNGPQHDTAWSDELGVWKYGRETWDMLQFGLRLGEPQQIITTTPKVINLNLIKSILKQKSTVATRGSTYENQKNLSQAFMETILDRYEGTRLGRQELSAELLEDVPGALWSRELLEQQRTNEQPNFLKRIVVAVDPAVSNTDESDETGIVVCAVRGDIGYVLDDFTLRSTPKGWANAAISAYEQYEADLIVGEVNNGGDLVEHTIHSVDPDVPFKQVRASRGKRVRAEPVSSKYEQGKIWHLGTFPQLEDQMCSWTPDMTESPDRLDAMVWGFTELLFSNRKKAYSPPVGRT